MLKRKLHSFGTSQTAVITALALLLVAAALLVFLQSPAAAQSNDRAVSGVTLTSPNPGELVITWNAPGDAPDDYRVTWKKSDGKWHSYKNANTVEGGNAFPTGTSHTVTALEEGTAYQARVRARYFNDNGDLEKSGPWSDAVEITISATPSQDGEGDSNEGPSTSPPAKPTGLITAASHDSVLLAWDNPDDDTITGYQVLRGLDADNLAVLTDDTGSTSTSYTDSTVEADTTYAYAVRGRNAHGLGPQSDPVTVTTSAAPEEDEPPTSARQIAGAELTLDGQALDTDGPCNEDTIGDVTDACTINIDTTTAIFAVDGTLDSNDRLTVKIGRDKAAVDSASESADESDLRGTDQTVTLTFPAGISLMRVWGDEDDSPGGSEEHFFRVNVGHTATIEAVKPSIVEGEEEVRFRIILSSQAPAGGVNVRVELTPDGSYSVGPIAQADFRVHTVNVPQGQTQAILEVMSSRNEIQSHTAQVNAAILAGTGYTVGSDSEASVLVHDNDKVNVRFADGCGQTITVGEGAGEVSFDMVLDNPVSYDFSLVLTAIGATASNLNDFVGTDLKFLEFPAYQTRATATYRIIDSPQVERAEYFIIQALRNALDDDILTPTCGASNPELRIEITDDDTANIVLDAPEEVTEGEPIKIGLGPRPNDTCPVPFPFTTTVTVTADRANLENTPSRSETLELNVCDDPDRIKIRNDDRTTSEPVWQTIDRTGQQGDRRVTFTIGTLRSSDSRVSRLIPERRSATVIIKDKPNNKATGNRIIAGDPMVGQTLTLDISAISEPDGLTNARFTYRWYKTFLEDTEREDTEELSTADSYTVPEEDKGDRIRLTVSFTDDEGFQEEVTGAPTAAVVPYLEHYFRITEKSMIEAPTGTREVSTWVYLNDWPRVRSADGSRIHNWGVNPIVPFTIPYAVDYADGAAASWVGVADVTFTATRQSSHVIGFQSRSEMIVTIKQISKNAPYGEDLGKIIITLDDGIELPNGPKLNAREGQNVLTITILSNGK